MKKFYKYVTIEKTDNKEEYILRLSQQVKEDIQTIGFIQFKNKDKTILEKDDEFMVIEASKTILSFKIPFKAKVVKKNKDAVEDPSILSSDDQTKNWILIVTDIDKDVFESLEDF
ncbi:biotin/lipoyl attachment domain-containing protein [Mycoplasma yeatsii]|uniref:Glycine cleavage system H protein n=1 Tax=Mycoplasma yeatsii TaxID=51365 RepID=A0ABU0NFB3_9MOLU|nr:glycine cleavage system protein H [Mycoplasma yeatsii]MDQ0568130.1 glycine cleavage system H protein [Mycoplasma yeatsii]